MFHVTKASIKRAFNNKFMKDVLGAPFKYHYKKRYIGRPYPIKRGLRRIKDSK